MSPEPAPEVLRFRAVLEPRGLAAAVVMTDEQVAAIGRGAKTPPVVVTVNGHTFDGRIARMGDESLLGFRREVRDACGVEAGDEIELVVARATGPPRVELSPALAAALEGDPVARERFEQLAPYRRKELARRVTEAKRDETRERRVAETLSMLHEARTR
jgi:bifunctional DNA-binding transcriptional regulator/antitoxin component of YhaV-PrlF toxin-antitoxin module